MLWEASAINGFAIEASDGRLGTVTDLLFGGPFAEAALVELAEKVEQQSAA